MKWEFFFDKTLAEAVLELRQVLWMSPPDVLFEVADGALVGLCQHSLGQTKVATENKLVRFLGHVEEIIADVWPWIGGLFTGKQAFWHLSFKPFLSFHAFTFHRYFVFIYTA